MRYLQVPTLIVVITGCAAPAPSATDMRTLEQNIRRSAGPALLVAAMAIYSGDPLDIAERDALLRPRATHLGHPSTA